MPVSLDFECEGLEPEKIQDVYFTCDKECPGTRSCYSDVTWVEEFIKRFDCLEDAVPGNNSDDIMERLPDGGICLCSTWYGFTGKDCTTYSEFTMILFALHVVVGFLAVWAALSGISISQQLKKRNAPRGKALFYSVVTNTIACITLIGWKLSAIIILLSPEQSTLDADRGRYIMENNNLQKIHPAEKFAQSIFIAATGIFALLGWFTLSLMCKPS